MTIISIKIKFIKILYSTILILLTLLFIKPLAHAAISVSFSGAQEESAKAGYLQLEWHWQHQNPNGPKTPSNQDSEPQSKQTLPQKWKYQLQRDDRSEEFQHATTVYRGKDAASFVSGLSDGKHYYRVRIIDTKGQSVSPWSEKKTVVVDYHSWTLTWILFATGATIFFILVAVLVIGSRKEKSSQSEQS